jgi:hypothetical protein
VNFGAESNYEREENVMSVVVDLERAVNERYVQAAEDGKAELCLAFLA